MPGITRGRWPGNRRAHYDDNVSKIGRVFLDSVPRMIIESQNQYTTQMSKQLTELSRIMANGLGQDKLAVVHSKQAKLAATAVRRSYAAQVHKKGPPSYRMGQGRFSGGVLRKLLDSDRLVTGNARGIQFIHTGPLNQDAKQWARLNFGAQGENSRGATQGVFTMQFGQIVIGSLSLNEPVRPAFKIPKGVWSEAGEFFPASQRANAGPGARYQAMKFPTRGIRGYNFFDAGLAVIAETPKQYKLMLDALWKEGISTVRPARISTEVIATRMPRYEVWPDEVAPIPLGQGSLFSIFRYTGR